MILILVASYSQGSHADHISSYQTVRKKDGNCSHLENFLAMEISAKHNQTFDVTLYQRLFVFLLRLCEETKSKIKGKILDTPIFWI